jgi:hypothetical protein
VTGVQTCALPICHTHKNNKSSIPVGLTTFPKS